MIPDRVSDPCNAPLGPKSRTRVVPKQSIAQTSKSASCVQQRGCLDRIARTDFAWLQLLLNPTRFCFDLVNDLVGSLPDVGILDGDRVASGSHAGVETSVIIKLSCA